MQKGPNRGSIGKAVGPVGGLKLDHIGQHQPDIVRHQEQQIERVAQRE